MKKIFFFVFCAISLSSSGISAQDAPVIRLENPSFEGVAKKGALNVDFRLRSWFDCGFSEESPPDVHPGRDNDGPFFEVTQKAQKGNTFLGLVSRDNDSWESVGQKLPSPILKDVCYSFAIHMVRSDTYLSRSRINLNQSKHYTAPILLRVWGGKSFCDRNELLAESELVINTNWKEYALKFEPNQNATHIIFEAFYQTPSPFLVCGNILLDNASPIAPIRCDEEDLLAVIEEARAVEEQELIAAATPKSTNKKKPDPVPDSYEIADAVRNTRIEPDPVVSPPPPKPKIIKDLDRKQLERGQTIRIDKLYFEADSISFSQNSIPVLDEVYEFLKANEDVVVEIGGHTNRIPEARYCDKLSTARAKSVVDYLASRGIEEYRLAYKGYGKRKPVSYPQTKESRQKNQRVEIKILSLNG